MTPVRVRRRNLDEDGFRNRGLEITRLEAFCDAVFGFALTLLVVSLDVPRTFDDLVVIMRGFPAFAFCFLFLTLIWNAHNKFCRRYGLDDGTTRFLTCIMLFLVLFYVYPLKFLFNFSITSLFTRGGSSLSLEQFSMLMLIYAFGFAAVYLALMFLCLHAYRLRDELELSELERFDTRYQIWRFGILVSVGLLAAVLSRFPSIVRYSGLIYLVLFPASRAQRLVHRRQRARYLAAARAG